MEPLTEPIEDGSIPTKCPLCSALGTRGPTQEEAAAWRKGIPINTASSRPEYCGDCLLNRAKEVEALKIANGELPL